MFSNDRGIIYGFIFEILVYVAELIFDITSIPIIWYIGV